MIREWTFSEEGQVDGVNWRGQEKRSGLEGRCLYVYSPCLDARVQDTQDIREINYQCVINVYRYSSSL